MDPRCVFGIDGQRKRDVISVWCDPNTHLTTYPISHICSVKNAPSIAVNSIAIFGVDGHIIDWNLLSVFLWFY